MIYIGILESFRGFIGIIWDLYDLYRNELETLIDLHRIFMDLYRNIRTKI